MHRCSTPWAVTSHSTDVFLFSFHGGPICRPPRFVRSLGVLFGRLALPYHVAALLRPPHLEGGIISIE